MCVFSFTSAWYLDHLCMVTTAWVFPAIQSHTKPLIGIHSALQADSSIAPTLTITASRGHSFWHYCALEPAPIQSLHKWKHTGAPRYHQAWRSCFLNSLWTHIPYFPAADFYLSISDIWSVHRRVPPTGLEGLFIRSFDMSALLRTSKQIFKEDGFSLSLHW